MSNPLHPSLDAGQTERYLLARLPIVVLSTTRPYRGAPSRARALPAAPSRPPTVIDGETHEPVGTDPAVEWTGAPWPGCTMPPLLAEAAARAPKGSRFIAWIGRNFGGAAVEIISARPVIDVIATEVR